MNRVARQLSTLALAAVLVAVAVPARADVVTLSNGGEIRGKVLGTLKDGGEDVIRIETLTGAIVIVRKQDAEIVAPRSLDVEEYETLRKLVPNTVDGQWKLAEWCRERRLKEPRESHLQQIVELEPNHERARYGLGHTKRNGQWMSPAEVDAQMVSQGYVKYKGKYLTRQELEVLENTGQHFAAEQQWFEKVRLWQRWLTGRDSKRSLEALAQLRAIKDPDAVTALNRFLGEDESSQVRAVYVDVLSRIPGLRPVEPLVVTALNDLDGTIRSAALKAISPDQQPTAVALFAAELSNELNAVVRRAASALEEIGDPAVVPALIGALVTSHKYKVTVPAGNESSYTFRSDGAFSLGSGSGGGSVPLPPEIAQMLQAGQLPNGVVVHKVPNPGEQMRTKTVIVKYDHKNSDVLSALKKFTGEDFGYNERAWQLWQTSKKNAASKVPVLE